MHPFVVNGKDMYDGLLFTKELPYDMIGIRKACADVEGRVYEFKRRIIGS